MKLGLGPLRTGIFNAADVAIMLGAGFVAFAELRRNKNGRPPTRTSDGTA